MSAKTTVSLGAIQKAFRPVTVDLWDEKFHTVDLPRSGTEKLRELLDASDEDDDKVFDILDLLLAPANGSKATPSELLRPAYAKDELSTRALGELVEEILARQSEANVRPTS